MERTLASIKEHLKPTINILVVDDDDTQLFAHREMLGSPVIHIEPCSSLGQAKDRIRGFKAPWHCWVVDINLGMGQNGLDLLNLRPKFPFSIILSGMQSLRLGSEAIRNGAIGVFDKDSGSLELLYDEVCKVAALGYVLEGKGTQYLGNFTLLKNKTVQSSEEWAKLACISVRQIERICALYSSLTPRYAIALYYTMYRLLRNEIQLPEEPGFSCTYSDFFSSCAQYVLYTLKKTACAA